MSENPSLDVALRRLHTALSALEELAPAHDGEAAPPEPDDRAQLLDALQASTERADRLDGANRDVAHRIDQTIDTLRSVLDSPARPDAR